MDKERCDKLLLDCMTMQFSFSTGDVSVDYRDVVDLITDRRESRTEIRRQAEEIKELRGEVEDKSRICIALRFTLIGSDKTVGEQQAEIERLRMERDKLSVLAQRCARHVPPNICLEWTDLRREAAEKGGE